MTQAGSDYLGDEEIAIYEYSPTFGAYVLTRHNLLDPRLKSAQDSGITVNLSLVITTRLIHVRYSAPTLEQTITKSPSDLRSIEVSRSFTAWTVKLMFVDCFKVCFNCTRPHLVALDIWCRFCQALIAIHGSKGDIDMAIREIQRCCVSTLRVPDDYAALRADEVNMLIGNGFTFPIDSNPFLNGDILRATANTWFNKNKHRLLSPGNNLTAISDDRNNDGDAINRSIEAQPDKGFAAFDIDIYVPRFSFGTSAIVIEWDTGIIDKLGLAEFRLRAFRARQGPRSQPAPPSAGDPVLLLEAH